MDGPHTSTRLSDDLFGAVLRRIHPDETLQVSTRKEFPFHIEAEHCAITIVPRQFPEGEYDPLVRRGQSMPEAAELRRRNRLAVTDKNGEEREVFGWATVQCTSTVCGSNPVVDHGEPTISAGDAIGMDPDAVTHWLAEEIETEFQIDLRDHGIDVIDPMSEGKDVL